MAKQGIDIVLVNYRSAPDTVVALDRLDGWTHGTVWVVNNSAGDHDAQSDSHQLEAACARWPWVTLLTPESNLGFGCACNLAFGQSKAAFFLLLNPDARITNDAIQALGQVLVDHPELAAVSPKTFWNDEQTFLLPAPSPQSPWHSLAMATATRFPRLTTVVANRSVASSMRQTGRTHHRRVRFLAGAVTLLRREAVQAAGGLFDPRFFMFFEDTDLSLRLRASGYHLGLVPQVSAVHTYRHKAYKAPLMEASQRAFFAKQHPRFYRWSHELKRLARLAKPIAPDVWFSEVAGPIKHHEHFSSLTNHAPVLAFSPVLLMMPSIVRPTVQDARPFSAPEWDLLEPAPYVAMLQDPRHPDRRRWVHFERTHSD